MVYLAFVPLRTCNVGNLVNVVHNICHEKQHILEGCNTTDDEVGLEPVKYNDDSTLKVVLNALHTNINSMKELSTYIVVISTYCAGRPAFIWSFGRFLTTAILTSAAQPINSSVSLLQHSLHLNKSALGLDPGRSMKVMRCSVVVS